MAGLLDHDEGVAFIGLDVGTGGARAVVLDEDMGLLGRREVRLPPGRRTDDGGHRLDEAVILGATREVIERVCAPQAVTPVALSVSGTAGTLCFRDREGAPAVEAVAYDDGRFGSGMARLEAWADLIPDAFRVIPIADAVLESFGAPPGGTDWTNALKLGWDPVGLRWLGEAGVLPAGFLPEPVPPGTTAGRAVEPADLRGAWLVRGATDGCAMHAAFGPSRPGDWSVGLGTTLIWKSVLVGESAGSLELPPGAYVHRLRRDLWLPGAASNSGGGVLEALEPGADLGRGDVDATLPSGLAAYPLARPGERFPVNDPAFAGFGLPPGDDRRLHAAILEGEAFVARLGIERLVAAGVSRPARLWVTGGGARSPTWMGLLASVLDRPVIAAPDTDPALGAALIAAAGVLGEPVATMAPGPDSQGRQVTYEPSHELRAALEESYEAFLGRVPPS